MAKPDAEKLIENSKPLLLIGSPINPGGGDKERARGGSALGIHLRAVRNTTARGSVFPSRTLTFCRQFGTDNNGGFHEQVSRHVPDSD